VPHAIEAKPAHEPEKSCKRILVTVLLLIVIVGFVDLAVNVYQTSSFAVPHPRVIAVYVAAIGKDPATLLQAGAEVIVVALPQSSVCATVKDGRNRKKRQYIIL
jgi:hypothetical protein